MYVRKMICAIRPKVWSSSLYSSEDRNEQELHNKARNVGLLRITYVFLYSIEK